MPGLNTKSYYTGVVDNNDLAYVIERFGNPRRVLPAPISRFKIGEHRGKPKINPHVSSFLMKDGRTVSVFHVKPAYYLHVNGEWRPLSEVTTYYGNRKLILNNKWEQIEPWYLRWLMKRCELIGGQVLIPWRFDNIPIREGKEIYFTVTTVYPDPDPETSTVDGAVRNSGTVYSTVRGAVDGESAYPSATAEFASSNSFFDPNYFINRGFFLFDTSSITDTDTIDSAILSIVGDNAGFAKQDEQDESINIFTSTPASNTDIVIGDFDQVGSTAQATEINITNWSNTAYNDFTLNATGLGNISKTSITKFGTRNNGDVNNTTPTGRNRPGATYAETTGTTSDPKLAVTHSAAAGSVMSYFMGSGFWGA